MSVGISTPLVFYYKSRNFSENPNKTYLCKHLTFQKVLIKDEISVYRRRVGVQDRSLDR